MALSEELEDSLSEEIEDDKTDDGGVPGEGADA